MTQDQKTNNQTNKQTPQQTNTKQTKKPQLIAYRSTLFWLRSYSFMLKGVIR